MVSKAPIENGHEMMNNHGQNRGFTHAFQDSICACM